MKRVLAFCALLLLCGCGDNINNRVIEKASEPVESVEVLKAESTEPIEETRVEAAIETTPDPISDPILEPAFDPAGESVSGPVPTERLFTISYAGDVALGNYYLQGYSNSFDQMYLEKDDKYFFEKVYPIFSKDDLTLVNLECVLTTSEERNGERTYYIKGAPEYAKILTAGSVEAVSMANNHRLDYGTAGSKDTVAAVTRENITYAYERNLGIVDCDGISVGYVAVNAIGTGRGPEKNIARGIEALTEQGADLIIVCCHWGIEREYFPNEYQVALGHKAIDLGADVVIGHHPHVLQGIEEYQGKPIVYSLGNFCFGANKNPSDKDTMIFQQTFRFVEGEKQEDTIAKVIPCSLSSVSNRNDYRPTPCEAEEAARIIGRLNEFSAELGVKIAEDGTLNAK